METTYPLSNLPKEKCVELVQDILNLDSKYDIKEYENSFAGIDLWRSDAKGKPEILVQVKTVVEITAFSLENVVDNIREAITLLKPEKYILVYFSDLKFPVFQDLGSSFEYFDIFWIKNQLEKYPKLVLKHNIRSIDVKKKTKIVQEKSTPSTLKLDITNYTNKYRAIIDSPDYHFQKALDELEELKYFGTSFNKKKEPETTNITLSYYQKLAEIWHTGMKPSEFSEYLKPENSELVPLYEKICKFLSYVDKNAWNRQVLNDYNDKRYIARTGVQHSHLLKHFLEFALNNFRLDKIPKDRIFNRIIEYLQEPEKKISIFSNNHRRFISLYLFGRACEWEEFHNKLGSYFDEYRISVKNPFNRTYFYTIILYDKTIRSLWERGRDDSFEDSFNIPDNNSSEPIEDFSDDINLVKDKIPFHLDKVVYEDKLGREPVAKAFVNLIKSDIFTRDLNHSFMVHLQGEWGIGKSSFLNIIKKHLSTNREKWIVVDYNAWQNQHISPPWWTLIDQIYRQSKSEMSFGSCCILWLKENDRRIIWYSGWQKLLSLFLALAFIILIFSFGDAILEILSNNIVSEQSINNQSKGLTIDIFAKLIITISSVVGLMYSLSKFITTPFFLKSSKEAVSFMSRASDPTARIKKHFGKLVDNINLSKKNNKRQLAIFIDDIDRCNKKFIVELLEGVQTLFKEKRVLYIVAGDKKWIATSFGNTYNEFLDVNPKEHQLGELFLEKAFQLSLRMPIIQDEAKKEYWNYLLNITDKEEPKIDSANLLSKTDISELKRAAEDLGKAAANISNEVTMEELEKKFNLSADAVSDFVIEEKNKDKVELQHLLKGYYSLVDTNPRSIIRLANNYTMTRSTLIAERKYLVADKIFRWLLIEDLVPSLKEPVKKFVSIEQVKEFLLQIDNIKMKENCIELLQGNQEKEESPLMLEEIKNIIGV